MNSQLIKAKSELAKISETTKEYTFKLESMKQYNVNDMQVMRKDYELKLEQMSKKHVSQIELIVQ